MDKNQIVVIYGRDAKTMTKKLLNRVAAAEMIPPSSSVGLKPNLVVAKKATSGATTTPEIVAGVIEYLQENGFSEISIMEGAWTGADTDHAFRAAGYDALQKKYGTPLVNLQKDEHKNFTSGGLSLKICRRSLAVDFLINLPVLKGHCQTHYTGALKNLKGCIPDSEKRRYHSLGIHEPVARLNTILKPRLHIMDGLNGDLDFEEGGSPVRMDRLIAARDPVLLDTYGASLVGFDKSRIPYIGLAERYGVGSSNLEPNQIVEMNKGQSALPGAAVTGRAMRLGRFLEARAACSACYGTLVHALKRLEEENGLDRLADFGKIKVGQGFKGEKAGGLGFGACAAGCREFVPGCPPKANDLLKRIV